LLTEAGGVALVTALSFWYVLPAIYGDFMLFEMLGRWTGMLAAVSGAVCAILLFVTIFRVLWRW
jgi:hypothetical protein